MAAPSRFTSGITTADRNTTLAQFGLPDPTGWHTYFNFAAIER